MSAEQNKAMSRTPIYVLVLTVALLGVFAVGRAVDTTAQDATSLAEGQGFVGSWRAMVTLPQGPSFPSLVTFGADGTVTTANQPVQPSPGAPGQVVFASAGHGAWQATGPDTAVFTFVVLLSDGQGNLAGVSTTRAGLTLGADGQTFSGEGVPTIADPAGNVLATFRATVQATRIAAAARPLIDLQPFIARATSVGCADQRNQLYVIDDQLVLWITRGGCADASYRTALFGHTLDDLRCDLHDSIAGPIRTCVDASVRPLFDIILANDQAPDLGLGPDHRVVLAWSASSSRN